MKKEADGRSAICQILRELNVRRKNKFFAWNERDPMKQYQVDWDSAEEKEICPHFLVLPMVQQVQHRPKPMYPLVLWCWCPTSCHIPIGTEHREGQFS